MAYPNQPLVFFVLVSVIGMASAIDTAWHDDAHATPYDGSGKHFVTANSTFSTVFYRYKQCNISWNVYVNSFIISFFLVHMHSVRGFQHHVILGIHGTNHVAFETETYQEPVYTNCYGYTI